MGNRNPNKPQSGIPGLIWRSRSSARSAGSWVVVLTIPKALRHLARSSSGNSLTRLEKSTGTSDLKAAREVYPALRAQLDQQLQQLTGLSKSPVTDTGPVIGDALRQREAQIKHQIADHFAQVINLDDHATTYIDQRLDEILSQLNTAQLSALGQALKVRVDACVRELMRRTGTAHDNPQLFDASKNAFLYAQKVAGTELKDRRHKGLLHEPSPAAQQLIAQANAPKPVSLQEVMDLAKQEWSARTALNYQGLLKRWMELIGDGGLDALSTANLNKFARAMHKPVNKGGRGYGKQAANDATYRIRSLLNAYNAQIAGDDNRIALPSFDPIPITAADQKQRRLKNRELAITDANATAIARYGLANDDDLLMITVMLRLTGLRNGEMATLRWEQIRLDDEFPVIDLLDAKTANGIRLVPINEKLQQFLAPRRPIKAADQQNFLLNGGIPKRRTPATGVSTLLLNTKTKLNLSGACNPHAFRHTVGGELGYSVREHIKKKILGHEGGMTDHYSREDLAQLNEAMQVVGQNWDIPSV